MNNDHVGGGIMKAVRNYQVSVQGRTRMPMRRWPTARFAIALLAPILMLPFCVAQEINSQAPRANESALSHADRDKVIYVSDFDLDAANFKQDKGGITGK